METSTRPVIRGRSQIIITSQVCRDGFLSLGMLFRASKPVDAKVSRARGLGEIRSGMRLRVDSATDDLGHAALILAEAVLSLTETPLEALPWERCV